MKYLHIKKAAENEFNCLNNKYLGVFFTRNTSIGIPKAILQYQHQWQSQ
jgi:hypothetical protein